MTSDLMDRIAAANPVPAGTSIVDQLWSADDLRSAIEERRAGDPGRLIQPAPPRRIRPVWAGVVAFLAVLALFALPIILGWSDGDSPLTTTPGDGIITTSIGNFSWWHEVGDHPEASEPGGWSIPSPPEGFEEGLLVQPGDNYFWTSQGRLWRLSGSSWFELTLDLSGVAVAPPGVPLPGFESSLGFPVASGRVVLVPWSIRIEGASPHPASIDGWMSGVGVLLPDLHVAAYIPPWMTGEVTAEPYDNLVGWSGGFIAFTGGTHFDELGSHRATTGMWLSENGLDWVASVAPGPMANREGWVSAHFHDWPGSERDVLSAFVNLRSGWVEFWTSENGLDWVFTGISEPEASAWEMPIYRLETGWVLFPGGDRMATSPDLRVWTPVDTSSMGIGTVGRSGTYSRTAYGFGDTIYWELVDSEDGREAWIMELVR